MARFATDGGAFEVESLPGQAQVAICHSFFVKADRRNQHHGHALKALQNIIIKEMNFDYAICTVSSKNEAQKKVLTKAGWMFLTNFENRRLNEITEIWGHEQKQV